MHSCRLVVSKGTPLRPGSCDHESECRPRPRSTALDVTRFRGRYRFTPSWTVRKGAVIELRPAPATRLRRPATVKIVLASGYPRAVVPDVQNHDVASAEGQLAAKHLGAHIVYRLTNDTPNLVLRADSRGGRDGLQRNAGPADGFADAALGESARAVGNGRLRERCVYRPRGTGGSGIDSLPARSGRRSPRSGGRRERSVRRRELRRRSRPGGVRTYAVAGDAGTYRLAVSPYGETNWYVEVDALE